MLRTNKELWHFLNQEADKHRRRSGKWDQSHAVTNALTNANDTVNEQPELEYDSDDYWYIAVASISCSVESNAYGSARHNRIVRWFDRRGLQF